jgi:hypothetical protein
MAAQNIITINRVDQTVISEVAINLFIGPQRSDGAHAVVGNPNTIIIAAMK